VYHKTVFILASQFADTGAGGTTTYSTHSLLMYFCSFMKKSQPVISLLIRREYLCHFI